MAPAVKKPKMEELLTRIAQLEEVVFTTPRLHRKDLAQMLGVSLRTLARRMKRRDFPRPIYDAGRPKWRPSDFNGHSGQTA